MAIVTLLFKSQINYRWRPPGPADPTLRPGQASTGGTSIHPNAGSGLLAFPTDNDLPVNTFRPAPSTPFLKYVERRMYSCASTGMMEACPE